MRITKVIVATLAAVATSLIVPDPAYAAGPVSLAMGVVQVNGAPASSATVASAIWPNGEALAALSEDAPVSLLNLTTANADSTGNFVVTVDPTTIPAEFQDAGHIDIEFTVYNAGQQASWHISTPVPSDGSFYVIPFLTFEMGSHPTVTESLNHRSAWVNENNQQLGLSDQQELTLLPEAPVCLPLAGPTFRNVPEHFMNAVAWSGAPATVHEETSSLHHLGVSISYNSGATWGVSGTANISVSSAASGSYGPIINKTIYNRVIYREARYSCTFTRKRIPVGFDDIIDNTRFYSIIVGAPLGLNCVEKIGGTWTKTLGRSVTYGAGVVLGGVGLSAQAGYDTKTNISFTVTSKSYLCGDTSNSWIHAPIVGTWRKL